MLVTKFNCDEIFNSGIDCKLLVFYAKGFIHQSNFIHDKYEKMEIFVHLNKCQIQKANLLKSLLSFDDENFFITQSEVIQSKNKMFGKKSFKYL